MTIKQALWPFRFPPAAWMDQIANMSFFVHSCRWFVPIYLIYPKVKAQKEKNRYVLFLQQMEPITNQVNKTSLLKFTSPKKKKSYLSLLSCSQKQSRDSFAIMCFLRVIVCVDLFISFLSIDFLWETYVSLSDYKNYNFLFLYFYFLYKYLIHFLFFLFKGCRVCNWVIPENMVWQLTTFQYHNWTRSAPKVYCPPLAAHYGWKINKLHL